MNSNQEQFKIYDAAELRRGEDHSVLQNAAAEVRSISNPALRFAVAECLKIKLDEISEQSVNDMLEMLKSESRQAH